MQNEDLKTCFFSMVRLSSWEKNMETMSIKVQGWGIQMFREIIFPEIRIGGLQMVAACRT